MGSVRSAGHDDNDRGGKNSTANPGRFAGLARPPCNGFAYGTGAADGRPDKRIAET